MKLQNHVVILTLTLALFALTACASSAPSSTNDSTDLLSRCGGGILSATDRSDSVLMDLSGSIIKRFPVKGLITHSAFSPDGRFLIYSDMTYGLFMGNIETGELKKLELKINGFPFHPAWSYDGSQLAFASGIPDEYGYTYIVNTDTLSSPISLPHAENTDFEEPESWRENGDLLLSVNGDIHNPYPVGKVYFSELVIVNTNSGERKTIYTSASYSLHGQWSPDGQWIVVTEGNPWITFLLDWKNNTKKALEKIPSNSRNPVWSPNGKCIAFLDPSNYIKVYILEADEIRDLSTIGGYRALAWGK